MTMLIQVKLILKKYDVNIQKIRSKIPQNASFTIFHSFANIKGPIDGLWVFLSMKTTLNPLPNDLRKSIKPKNSQSQKQGYLPTVHWMYLLETRFTCMVDYERLVLLYNSHSREFLARVARHKSKIIRTIELNIGLLVQ